jgi:tetratricopeptide (TPR) repeat protein
MEALLEKNLALLHRDQGALEEACQELHQALWLQRQIADRVGEGQVLVHLAFIRWRQGLLEQARQVAEEALAVQRQIGFRRWEGLALSLLAQIRTDEGHVQEARGLYTQALPILREVQDRLYEAETLCGLAVLERRSGGDPAGAARLAEQAEAISRELGIARDRLLWLCERGHGALAQAASGREFLDEAARLLAELGFGSEGRHGHAVARLRRAVEAFEAGRPLFRGECPEDVPEGFRHRAE